MKKTILFLTLLAYGNFGISQSSLPKHVSDSLWGVWSDGQQSDYLRLSAIQKFISDGLLHAYPDSAFTLAQMQLDLARLGHLRKYEADALNTLGNCLSIKENLFGAGSLFSESFEIYGEIGDTNGMASALLNIGLIQEEQGNLYEALKYYDQSLTLYRAVQNEAGVAMVTMNKGIVLSNQGIEDAAMENYVSALKYFETTGDTGKISKSYLNLGHTCESLGDYRNAIAYYSMALKLERQLGNSKGIAIAMIGMGNVHVLFGNEKKGIEYYLQVIEFDKQSGDKVNVAYALNNLGVISASIAENEQALNYYHQSLQIWKELGNKRGEALTLINLGLIHRDMGDFSSAMQYLQDSYSMRISSGDKPGMAACMNNIGRIHLLQGDYASGIEDCREALALAVDAQVSIQTKATIRNLIAAYISTDSVSESNRMVDQLLGLLNKELLLNFPVLSEKDKELYFTAMQSDFELLYDFALRHHDSIADLTDKSYNQILCHKGMLLKSSTAMRNSIISSGDNTLISQYNEWIELKRKISRGFSSGRDTRELEELADSIEVSLVGQSDDFSDVRRMQEISWKNVQQSLAQGQSAIEFVRFTHKENQFLNQTGEVYYCALIVRPGDEHPAMVKLFIESELEKILGSFPGNNASYINRVYGSRDDTKTKLYDLIWKPMEKALEGVKKVYVSPVGLLHKISLPALAKEQNVLLCDLYNIETQSSTGSIAVNSAPRTLDENRQATLFGGIDYNSDSTSSQIWQYLDGSLAEAQKIEKILRNSGQHVNYYNLSSATEEQFKRAASRSNILHIATHGFFYADPNELMASVVDEKESAGHVNFRGGTSGFGVHSFVKNKNPLMRSGLVFAGANDVWNRTTAADDPIAVGFENNDSTYKEDGVLTAAEVATIDMRKTELVVLSACETGLGDIKGSEGVYGLQRAFKMAGVKYIIMSLWQVPDKETAEFMTLFYKNLTKVSDIRKAFTMTQKTMREKYDPYYWGAFVLIE